MKNILNALYNTGIVNSLPSYNNSRYHIGYLNSYSAQSNFRHKNRNLLGDPEMMVWTNAPQNLTVSSLNYSSANKQITGTVSGLTFSTTPIVIVTVTAWKGNEIWQTMDIPATTASVPFTLSNVFAHTQGNIIVTVTAHNYIPKINTIPVSAPIGAHPYMTNNIIDDDNLGGSTGNNDAYPDAGETIQLPITLTNSGNATALNVTTTLSTTNAAITINTGSSNFGNIVAFGTATNNSNPFAFTIDTNAFNSITPRPLTQFVNFTLSIDVNGSPFSTESFSIQFAEPNLDKGENTVTGTLLAGSSNQLTIKLYNIGLSEATGLNAVLSENSDPFNRISITNATSSYNNINGTDNATNFGTNNITFNFDIVGSNYVNETFNLTVTNAYGKIWTFSNFDLTKPKINTVASTISHFGYATSIEPYWKIVLSSGAAIKGYNLFRSSSINGPWNLSTKVNSNLISYSSYLDQGLQQLTKYYYELTVVDVNGNESDLYPPTDVNPIGNPDGVPDGYLASTSLPLHAGWNPPIGSSVFPSIVGRAFGSPITYDLFEDGKKEIFFTTGDDNKGGVWAFKEDGTRWYSGAYIDLQCKTLATPAIADIDGDGIDELAVTTNNGASINSQKILVYDAPATSASPTNQPTNYPVSINGWETVKGAVYSDIDNDGNLEVITNNMGNGNPAPGIFVDGGLKVYDANGSPHPGWLNGQNIPLGTEGYECGFSMPVAYDFNNDGKKEVVIGCTGAGIYPAGIYIFNEDGTNYNGGGNTPQRVYTPAVGYRTDSPPVIADIDNDCIYEILFISAKIKNANIYAMHADGTLLSGWDNTSHPSFTLSNSVVDAANTYNGISLPTLSVGDLNKDGHLEVVCGDKDNLFVWNYLGTLLQTLVIPGYATNSFKAPILADIDNISTDLEMIVTNDLPPPAEGANIFAYKLNGQLASGFPITIDVGVGNSPCVDDIDNDGLNELIIISGNKFFVWDSEGDAGNNIYGWTSYRHDNYNSGVYKNAFTFNNFTAATSAQFPTATQTWTPGNNPFGNVGTVTIGNSLVIPSGFNVTVQGMTFQFASSSAANVVVERGAQLSLNNSKFTSFKGGCGSDMWQGIEVWGTRTASQTTSGTQGKVILTNGAIIENAMEAITTIKTDASGNWDWSFTGGIVQCRNAAFSNCRRAAQFLSYTLPNTSYFSNCTFETTGLLADPNVKPYAFVSLYDVKGVRFFGNTFRNTNPNVFNAPDRGTGIISIDAAYNVIGRCTSQALPCTSFQRGKFENLYYGIHASNSNYLNTVTINRTDFTGNSQGMLLTNNKNATITSNTFDVGQINDPVTPYGLYLNYCRGYQVEDNDFISSQSQFSYGSIVNNAKVNNRIYRNRYRDNSIGLQYQGILAPPPTGGLQMKCNDFTQNLYSNVDIAVTSGVIGNQGFCSNNTTTPAGNTFGTCKSFINPFKHIWANTGAGGFSYSHHTDAFTIPFCHTGQVSLTQCTTAYNVSTSCPSTLIPPCNLDCERQIISQINTLSAALVAGDAPSLYQIIASNSSPGQIKNALLAPGPYLSNGVLISAITRTNPLPPGHIKEIVVPNSPVTSPVMNALNSVTLPKGIRKEIMDAQTGISLRSQVDIVPAIISSESRSGDSAGKKRKIIMCLLLEK